MPEDALKCVRSRFSLGRDEGGVSGKRGQPGVVCQVESINYYGLRKWFAWIRDRNTQLTRIYHPQARQIIHLPFGGAE